MVAGANRNEVLTAFREAVDDAIANGETLEDSASVLMTLWQIPAGNITAGETGAPGLFTTPTFMARITEDDWRSIWIWSMYCLIGSITTMITNIRARSILR